MTRLTTLSHGGGCACKLSPADLGQALAMLPPVVDPAVLVGFATKDDAAVYRLGEHGLVATIDIFTPIVDDPYEFGQIAAANALSDVYAMGGRPLFALSFVGFPSKTLPLSDLGAILRGGADKCAEAGVFIVGGHSIDDAEPKFGLSVTGVVDPERIVRNSTARAGDVLVLTKAIGTGAIASGIKSGRATPAEAAGAIASMSRLNRDACAAMLEVGVHAATDVTGFGLMGHLHEVVHASGLSALIKSHAVPLLDGARRLVDAGVLSGGSRRNADHFGAWIDWSADVDPTTRAILCDAQTSGGLLMCVAADKLAALQAALTARGVLAAEIGHLAAGEAGRIRVG